MQGVLLSLAVFSAAAFACYGRLTVIVVKSSGPPHQLAAPQFAFHETKQPKTGPTLGLQATVKYHGKGPHKGSGGHIGSLLQ